MTDLGISKVCAEAVGRIPGKQAREVVWFDLPESAIIASNSKGGEDVWSPLTDPAQNQECLWWLIEQGYSIHMKGADMRVRQTNPLIRDSDAQVFPIRSRSELMRAVCMAVCAVKEAVNG